MERNILLIGSLSHYLEGFYTSQVVQDFFHQQYVRLKGQIHCNGYNRGKVAQENDETKDFTFQPLGAFRLHEPATGQDIYNFSWNQTFLKGKQHCTIRKGTSLKFDRELNPLHKTRCCTSSLLDCNRVETHLGVSCKKLFTQRNAIFSNKIMLLRTQKKHNFSQLSWTVAF